jgi:hypothetical protein
MVMQQYFTIIIMFFSLSVYSQIHTIDVIIAAIENDSLGFAQATEVSEKTIIYISLGSLEDPKPQTLDFSSGLKLEVLEKWEYQRMKPEEKKRYPIIFFEKLQIESDKIIFYVLGSSFAYRSKKEDYYFTFSNQIVTYFYDHSKKNWHILNIKNLSE